MVQDGAYEQHEVSRSWLVALCAVSGSVEIETIAWTAAVSLIQSGGLGV